MGNRTRRLPTSGLTGYFRRSSINSAPKRVMEDWITVNLGNSDRTMSAVYLLRTRLYGNSFLHFGVSERHAYKHILKEAI